MSTDQRDLEAGDSSQAAIASATDFEDKKQASTASNSSHPQFEQDVQDKFLVEYEGPDDPLDPQNLPQWKKWCYAFNLGFMTLSITFASSVFSTATRAAADEFGVSNQVMTLGTALFIAGASSPVHFYLARNVGP